MKPWVSKRTGLLEVGWKQEVPTALKGWIVPWALSATAVLLVIGIGSLILSMGLLGAVFVYVIAVAIVMGAGVPLVMLVMRSDAYRVWSQSFITKNVGVTAWSDGKEFGCRREANGKEIEDKTSLAQLVSFEIGHYKDWFAPVHEQNRLKEYLVIVAHVNEDAPRIIAEHAGSRAEIAEVHGTLTREFIENKTVLMGGPSIRIARDNPPKL